MKRVFPILLLVPSGIRAQNVISPLGGPADHILTRTEILYGVEGNHHSGILPYQRADIIAQALHTSLVPGLSDLELFDLQYLFNDNTAVLKDSSPVLNYPGLQKVQQSKKPVFKTFYRTPANLFEVNTPDFYLRLNPILDLSYGNIQDDSDPYYINRRGAEVHGGIDGKVYFYANVLETQTRYPEYIQRWVRQFEALPDAGLFKNYKSDLFAFDDGYDYLTSNGFIGFDISKHVGLQLGHGKNFIGHGYRSLFLSDFSKNAFYLKLNTRVWKFHYQNIFAELGAKEKDRGEDLVPKKFLAAHYLSFNVTRKVQLGLYEAVIFAREKNRFEFQYLNPIIFYRSVEHHVGSPDNVLLGMSFRWDVFQRIRVYAQVMLDELKVGEIFSSRNWWGNKVGYQFGVRYINAFGIDHLDLQAEINRVRPYTYSHRDSLGSYTHFNQPLAHPLGANFREHLIIVQYKPGKKWEVRNRLFFIRTGEDDGFHNYGMNIVKPNVTRISDFGIEQGQGISVDQIIWDVQLSYMLRHNLFLDLRYFYRTYDSAFDGNDLNTQFISAGLRLNFYPLRLNF